MVTGYAAVTNAGPLFTVFRARYLGSNLHTISRFNAQFHFGSA